MVYKLEYGKEVLENLKINLNLLKEKGINSDKEYFELQSLYKKAFEMLMNQKLELDKFDQMLLNSTHDFGPLRNKTFYHKLSYLNLNYIYIRNFLFIEKLSIDSIQFLKEYKEKYNFDVNQTLLDFVEKTYFDIMKVDTKARVVTYGVASPLNAFSPDAVAIYINYGKNKNTLEKDEYIKNMLEKKQFLEEIVESIKKKGLENSMKVEVVFFKIG